MQLHNNVSTIHIQYMLLFMFKVNRLAKVPQFCNLNVHGFNCGCNVFQRSKTFKYMLGAVILLGCSAQQL